MIDNQNRIIEDVIEQYESLNLLTRPSLEKLQESMKTGRMTSEDWIRFFDLDRVQGNEKHHEN